LAAIDAILCNDSEIAIILTLFGFFCLNEKIGNKNFEYNSLND
jgi:hypothetical protein